MSHPDPMFDPENAYSEREIEVKSDQDMERNIQHLRDVESEELSACCGAPIVMSFCTDCKEHAE